jgi:hypothetical protein
MAVLDGGSVLGIGGWDKKHTQVLFVVECNDVALALLDADSEIYLEAFRRDEQRASQPGGGTVADVTGVGLVGGVVYAYAHIEPGTTVNVYYNDETLNAVADQKGWFCFIAPAAAADSIPLPTWQPQPVR